MKDDSDLWGTDSDSESEPSPPPPPGLHHFPSLIPLSLQHSLSLSLSTQFTSNSNQIMFFSSPSHPLPAFLDDLYPALSSLLFKKVPPRISQLLFNDSEGDKQAILNLYRPGEGIKHHVDLPHRYSEGILGISLLSSVVMDFLPLPPHTSEKPYSVLLQPGDVYVLEGKARYEYEHGIKSRGEDWVDGEVMRRGTRMSVTLRRMKRGANVVGEEDEKREREENVR